MDAFTATMIAEGEYELAGIDPYDDAIIIEAWQHLIDTGLAWRLQGTFGRQAQALIDAGICHR